MGWFQKKVELTVADEDGNPKKVKISKKQFDRWVAEGKIQEFEGCAVHIIDPMGNRTETWEIGKNIPREAYERFKHRDGNLYATVTYKGGQPDMKIVTKEYWDQLKAMGL